MRYKNIILISLMILVAQAAFASIDNVNVVVNYNNAVFNFTTDINTTAVIDYGTSIPLTQKATGPKATKHVIELKDLSPETIYSYRITTSNSYYPSNTTTINFTTPKGGNVNKGLIKYTLDQPITLTNNKTVPIKGTVDAGSKIRVSRKIDGAWFQQDLIVPSGKTLVYDAKKNNYSFSVMLSEGINEFQMTFMNPITYDKETTEFSVTSDRTPPSLEIMKIPEYSKGEVLLFGIIDPNSSMDIYMDKEMITSVSGTAPDENISAILRKVGFNVEKNYYINQSVSLGDEGRHNLTFKISDEAGNSREIKYSVYVDMTDPELTNLSIATITKTTVSTGIGHTSAFWTPYNPVNVKGFATDNSGNDQLKVVVQNNRNNTNCDEAEKKLQNKLANLYGWESIVTNDEGGFEISVEGQASLLGSLLGNTGAVETPDADGEFEVLINLMSPNVLTNETEKDNQICFFAIDRAGNMVMVDEVITYEPTSKLWRLDNYETDPNEIYSSWLKHADYPVGVMFDLKYTGAQNFDKIEVKDIKVEAIDDGIDQIGKIERAALDGAEPIYVKDDSTGTYKVYIQFPIMQDMEANKNLYEQDKMQFSFKILINYEYDKKAQTEQMQFGQATFLVETPYDFADWLTPELVNDELIPFFNDTKNFIEELSNFTLSPLLEYTQPTCIGLMAVVMVGTTTGWMTEPDSSLLKAMKMVCDRVYSPVVPPKGPMYFIDEDGNIKGEDSNGNLIDLKDDKDLVKIDDGANIEYPGGMFKDILGVDDAKEKDKWLGVTQKAYDFNNHGIYQAGTFLNPAPIPCNPVIIDKRTGASQSAMLNQNPLTIGKETQVYTVKEFASGMSQKRCYSEQPPYFDQYKCVGIWTNIMDPQYKDMNPMNDLFDSIRCGSFSGFYLQTQRIVRHLQAVLDCLYSIEEGIYDAGYCEQLLSTSACEMFQYVFDEFLAGIFDEKSVTFNSDDVVGKLTMDEMTNSYGAAITKTTGSEYTAGSLVHQACMMALGADISDFSAYLEDVISAQDRKPTIGPVFVQSQMNTFNPITGELTIQYKASPYIMAGKGADVSATLMLSCDRSKPNGEYCDSGRRTKPYPIGVIPKGTTYKDTLVINDVPAEVWYNLAWIEYSYLDVVPSESTEVEKKCYQGNICTDQGGQIKTDGKGPEGCELNYCLINTLVTTTSEKTYTQKTEPDKIFHRGGVRFGCVFDLNTAGGFVCQGGPVGGSTGLKLIDAKIVGGDTLYPQNDLQVILELDKKGYSKKDFLLSYVIKKKDGEAKEVTKGAIKFDTAETFGCYDGSDNMQKEKIIPVTIIQGTNSDGQGTNYELYGVKDLPDIEFTDDVTFDFTIQNTPSGSTFSKMIEITKISFKKSKDNDYIDCDFKDFTFDVENDQPITLPEIEEKVINKDKCKLFYDYEEETDSHGEFYYKIEEIKIYIKHSNKDTTYYSNIKKDEKTYTISINAVSSSDGNALAKGEYELILNLYYCSDNAQGDCGDVQKIDESNHKKIIFGTDTEAGQEEVLPYSVDIQDDSCDESPELYIVNPMPDTFVNAEKDSKEFLLLVYDDCQSDKKYKIDYHILNKGGESKGVGLKKTDSKLFDYVPAKNAPKNVYYFDLGLSTMKGEAYNTEFTVSMTVSDEKDKKKTKDFVYKTADSGSDYPECWAEGLSGTQSQAEYDKELAQGASASATNQETTPAAPENPSTPANPPASN